MIELLASEIEAHLSWRWLLQVVLLSGGLTLAALWSFRDDAASRRGLGVAAVWLLAVVPVLLLLLQPRYQIGVQNLPELPTLSPVPWFVLAVWLLVAIWGCSRIVAHIVRSQRRFRHLSVVSDTELEDMVSSYSARLGMREPALLYGANACASSLGSPKVMVPAEFMSWPETAKRAVIAHELVHLYRRDDRFMIALQALARCYLFCPWLHLLYARFVHSLEEACDERAAELVGARPEYLEGLAEAALREGGSSYATQQLNSEAHLIDPTHKSVFMRRLARLLGKQRFFEVQAGPLTAGMGFGLLVLCALTTFEFVEAPRASYAAASNRLVSIAPVLEPGFQQSLYSDRLFRPEVRVIDAPNARAERITPAIVFPGRAIMDGIEGQVLMEFSIAGDGSTVQSRVIRSTHPKYFDSTAIRAVQQTVYAPNYKNGFSGVNAAFRDARNSERVASNRVQKLFVFDLGKDPAQVVPTQASTQ